MAAFSGIVLLEECRDLALATKEASDLQYRQVLQV